MAASCPSSEQLLGKKGRVARVQPVSTSAAMLGGNKPPQKQDGGLAGAIFCAYDELPRRIKELQDMKVVMEIMSEDYKSVYEGLEKLQFDLKSIEEVVKDRDDLKKQINEMMGPECRIFFLMEKNRLLCETIKGTLKEGTEKLAKVQQVLESLKAGLEQRLAAQGQAMGKKEELVFKESLKEIRTETKNMEQDMQMAKAARAKAQKTLMDTLYAQEDLLRNVNQQKMHLELVSGVESLNRKFEETLTIGKNKLLKTQEKDERKEVEKTGQVLTKEDSCVGKRRKGKKGHTRDDQTTSDKVLEDSSSTMQ